jgi:hypothetical protein
VPQHAAPSDALKGKEAPKEEGPLKLAAVTNQVVATKTKQEPDDDTCQTQQQLQEGRPQSSCAEVQSLPAHQARHSRCSDAEVTPGAALSLLRHRSHRTLGEQVWELSGSAEELLPHALGTVLSVHKLGAPLLLSDAQHPMCLRHR